jgi:pilus assembly protein FimV
VRAVQQNPRDTEAHLNLLRLYHARGNAVEYEEAAQAMRGQIATTLDPRWREAVIMGASLLPGHALFNQAGWNTPRFGVPDPVASPVTDSMPEVAPAPPEPAIKAAEPISASGVFDLPEHEDSEPAMSVEASHPEDSHPEASHPEDSHVDEMHEFGEGELDLIDAPGDLANAIPGHNDIHRSESQVQEEDEASATRIELAKAYLDIGDLDGARSMLEEVLAEGGPAAQAEAERILREIG